MFETTVTLVGNVISTPRSREVANGARVTSFRMVSTARRFDRATERWVDGDRVFATVNCWKRLSDGVSNRVYKNDPVVVTGRLRTREYEVDGQRRSSTEVEAGAVGLDLARIRTDGREIEQARPVAEDPSALVEPVDREPLMTSGGG